MTASYKKPELTVIELALEDALTTSSASVVTTTTTVPVPTTTLPGTTLPRVTEQPGSTSPSTTRGGVEIGTGDIIIDVSDFFKN